MGDMHSARRLWFRAGALPRLRLRRSSESPPVRTVLCREGWRYLGLVGFVFCAAMLRQVNLLLMLAGMLVGPMLFHWRLVVATLRRLEVRRRLPRRLCAGDLLVVELQVTNTRKRLGSWAIAVEDQICREGERGFSPVLRPGVVFGYVPAGQSRTGVYRGRLVQRGRYRLGPLEVSTRFPFSLLARILTVDCYDTLLVYPRLGRLTQAWARRHHEAFEGAHRRERRHSRMSGDFYGVRAWQQGDTRRWIHWRSSARRGELVVRQYEQHRSRDVAMLVDLWRPESPAAQDLENVELAVSFAATVVSDLCRQGGSDVLLGVTGPAPECLEGPASLALLHDAMETLAVAEGAAEDRLPALLDRALGRIDPAADVVLVTTRPVDLGDPRRYGALWRDPARSLIARRIRVVNVASGKLAEYYALE